MRFRRGNTRGPFRAAYARGAVPPPAADLDQWLALTDSAGVTANEEIDLSDGSRSGGVGVQEADPRPLAQDLLARLFADAPTGPDGRSGPVEDLPVEHPAVERRVERFNRLDPRLVPRSVWARGR
ncbi:MAG: hypothetical protein ACK5RL_17355 [Acidimicrobiales bacterium]